MNGRPFQIASVTVRPKPSRVDFWMSTSDCDWKALTSIDADVVEVVEDVDVRVAVGVRDGRVEVVPALGVVGGHRADQRELHVGPLLLDQPVGVDDAERVLPRVEARDLGQISGRSTSMPNCWQT